jgi:predicted ATP-dependent protease
LVQALTKRLALKPEQLRRRLDPESLAFATTAEVPPLTVTVGQPRATDAISLALETSQPGFHLYAAGTPGAGRESTVLAAVQAYAATRPAPPDWIYVHNFIEADRPNAISLPAGQGRSFAKSMAEFLGTVQREIPRAFESEDYARRREAALAGVASRRERAIAELHEFARSRSFGLEMTPTGILTVALQDGKPIAAQTFEQLPAPVRTEIELRGKQVQDEVGKSMRQLRQLEKEAQEQIRQLEREIVHFVIDPLIADLRENHETQPDILAYLAQVALDLPEHLHDFWPVVEEGDGSAGPADGRLLQRQEHLARYGVNVLIDNNGAIGAPVVIERNPSFYNLLGRIDYRAIFGAMTTDFRQIKPGALHRANGGFLVVHILEVLRNPFAWDALKRSLICREVEIENLGDQVTAVPTARLRPETIPLDVKVVLIGRPGLYQLLHESDEDFPELFGVKADFASEMSWTDRHVQDYAAFISARVNELGLRHFDRGAVARVAEHGARLTEDQRKLTTRFLNIAALVTEASYWAGKADHEVVLAEDVDRAIDAKAYRANLAEERIRELIVDGTIMIATEGERIAQVNGLSVVSVGDYAFGQPSRVTARVSLGRGTIQSIEREIELSGPIHSKGFLILTGYLQAQYAQEWPLALGATITFEQSYGGIEGDSASSTELYALLSALSGLPLKQGIAVTGAVNQHGEVQAVGGVTRKIEGFYEVCTLRGLTGNQGVIIPAANVPNLMLREEVVDAVSDGRFHVWAVQSIDEGIALLTGTRAGTRGKSGQFPKGSVHRLVEDHLHTYAERARSFSVQANGARGPARQGVMTGGG